jgi:hypothetical protein
METFGTILGLGAYAFGSWIAMTIVYSGMKARRTRVNLQHIRDFMNRRDISRGKY